MSKRFLTFAEAWIKENIPPGGNPDLESHEDRAQRLMKEMFAEAAAANYSDAETKEERERIAPQVLAAVADDTDFDYDTYTLKRLLAEELEDGD